jgi:hypothetical protein
VSYTVAKNTTYGLDSLDDTDGANSLELTGSQVDRPCSFRVAQRLDKRTGNRHEVGLAPAVGFEPTTNRLTADRSTTELRWISN